MGEDPSEIREEIEETRRPRGRHRRGDRLKDRRQVARRGQGVRVDSVRSKVGGAGSRVNEATPGTEDVKQSAGKAAGGAQENPIGLALGSLAVGFSERHAHAVHQRGGREARRGLRPGKTRSRRPPRRRPTAASRSRRGPRRAPRTPRRRAASGTLRSSSRPLSSVRRRPGRLPGPRTIECRPQTRTPRQRAAPTGRPPARRSSPGARGVARSSAR
jgi:hypothetical protein